ncbi:exodeoxyribonuclease III [Microvirga tunisiensis]|uniref:Exodeoxyribonuclease III n=2 Tax=Pannonibacter tanglangensis TaxID=2750084 RepID=A0ABW9ZQH2_9HYPH|nr:MULTISPECIES: exodeoxyribonuclease III [unclassified Pannonibacter]NBN65826.1 exodeoxyribonuclease III [Pannonibacter sp. XCT-34]NBN80344.1 exodeoxyribonuclease III [Pannonibacter sp. XCT-53]
MTDRLTIATWNINSVRLRMPIVERLLRDHGPDVLCLQETKCPDANFPEGAFRKLGYEHVAINGQKGYHGVAVVSRRPLAEVERRGFCDKGDARHIAVSVPFGGTSLRLHNFYVPAGGDEPDREINEKFGHKLDFMGEMRSWLAGEEARRPAVVVGDLNVAPFEHDVWSHKALLKVVSHTPVETELFEEIRRAGNWIDAMREVVPPTDKLYTWWSYRAKDWDAADKGRRLDHVWLSQPLAGTLRSVAVLREARGWEKPSDHVPVMTVLEG